MPFFFLKILDIPMKIIKSGKQCFDESGFVPFLRTHQSLDTIFQAIKKNKTILDLANCK